MSVDHIRYDLLTQDALLGVVRRVLADAARKGLLGEHHFFISFDTNAAGVRMSDRLRAQHPDEMTVVLQHQFWDLIVTEQAFEVGLSFNGITERLFIPFEAIRSFADPSVRFGLQFDTTTRDQTEPAADSTGPETVAANGGKRLPSALPDSLRKLPAAAETPAPSGTTSPSSEDEPPHPPSGGAEVVRLDRFRKK